MVFADALAIATGYLSSGEVGGYRIIDSIDATITDLTSEITATIDTTDVQLTATITTVEEI